MQNTQTQSTLRSSFMGSKALNCSRVVSYGSSLRARAAFRPASSRKAGLDIRAEKVRAMGGPAQPRLGQTTGCS